ncbi:MAG: prolyl oligopeptidase family serine peptidase [Reichenbachiella sp.]
MKYKILTIISLVVFCQCQTKETPDTESEILKDTEVEALSDSVNLAWVKKNLDSVMVAHTFDASNGMEMPYRLYVPSKEGESLPLLIHLHGRGERGADNTPKIYNNIPLFNGSMSIVSPNGQMENPCFVLVPQCSDKTINEEWAKWVGNTPETPWEGLGKDGSYVMNEQPSESGAAALELIDWVIGNYNIDTSRIYLTGLSMGGFGTWEFIGRRPGLFTAAVPMAGYSDPRIVESIKHIPIRIYHGDIDEYNPVEGSRTMYKLLSAAGADVTYTEYQGVNHTPSFHKAWNEDSTLLPWIFAQQKK